MQSNFTGELIQDIKKKIIKANMQLKDDLANDAASLFIMSVTPAKLKSESYYCIIDRDKNSWTMFYVDKNGIKEMKKINPDIEFFLAQTKNMSENSNLPGLIDVNSLSLNKIKNNIVHSLALLAWYNNLNSIYDMAKNAVDKNIFHYALERALVELCSDCNELLLLIDDYDKDDPNLAGVVDIRFKKHQSNNTGLLVLNKFLTEMMMNNLHKNMRLVTINNLSVLYHWGNEEGWVPNPKLYAKKITDLTATFIPNMPNLKKLVMRGCSCASCDHIKEKRCRVISKKNNIETETVGENEFLFQQGFGTNKAEPITLIKFLDENNIEVTKTLYDIPKNTQGNKLSSEVEKKLALSAKDNDLPLLILPTLASHKSSIKTQWLDDDKITSEDRKLLKAIDINLRTIKVKQLPKNLFANCLEQSLQEKKINTNGIEIKLYTGPYQTNPHAGSIMDPSHGRQRLPKAIKVTASRNKDSLALFKNSKNIETLKEQFEKDPKYSLESNKTYTDEEAINFIQHLRSKANNGDDVAAYALAVQAENGFVYQSLVSNIIKTNTMKGFSLSLEFWLKLQDRGYSVSNDVKRVEMKESEEIEKHFSALNISSKPQRKSS